MRIELTGEQQMVQAMAREFAESEVRPIAEEIDRESRFPHETVKRMGELGLLGMSVPEAWGGSGSDGVTLALAVVEIARVCASHAVIMIVNNSLYCEPVLRFGTDAQRERFLRPVAAGHAQGCFALTEPQAGSDATNQATTAVRDGDGYVITGRKLFITTGREAAFALVFAQTDRARGHRGITAFVVEKGAPGFTVSKTEDKLGIRASDTAELVFEDCRVPADALLGTLHRGFYEIMKNFQNERLVLSGMAVGESREALDRTIRYVKDRKAFGATLWDKQVIRQRLAMLEARVEADLARGEHAELIAELRRRVRGRCHCFQ